jgi:hypothetical protein
LSKAFPPLSAEKRSTVIGRIQAGDTNKAISIGEGVNIKTVAKIRKQIGEAPQPKGDAPLGGSAKDRKIVSLTGEVTRLKQALKEAHTERDMDEAILQIVGDLKAAAPKPPVWLTHTLRRNSLVKQIEVPVVSFADWHCGETVSLSETNGVNEYNLDIADKRIERLVDTTIDLCRNHHSKDYPGIVVNLVGDFVSGALHPELAKSDELEVLPSVLWVLDRLEAALRRLADDFGQVFVPTAPGNHGRNTLKPEFKRYAYKNFDWFIYRLLADRFARDAAYKDRVSFLIDDSNTAFYRVFAKRFMLIHGDQMGVKGGDGIIGAIGPIMRGEIKVRGQQMTIGRNYDYLILGHWHQALWLPRAIVANSLKGFDEYAQNALRAVPSVPSQPLFFVHPKWGITSRWEVYCEGPRKVDDAASWVSVFGKAA